MARQPGDTRRRIQEVALELFGEQGYDKTSLQQIADRLDLTKAALYYHFKTKEDILAGTLHDYLSEVDELLDWAEGQPRGRRTRREIVRRYADLAQRRAQAMRFLQRHPAGLQKSELGEAFRSRMERLHLLLRDADAPLVDQVRALLAVIGMHVGMVAFGPDSPIGSGEPRDPDEIRAAVVQVAEELVARPSPRSRPSPAPDPDA